MKNKQLTPEQVESLLKILEIRFEKNMPRHKAIKWEKVKTKLDAHPEKLWSLYQMEQTEGEPDVVDYDQKTDEYIFFDCSPESPKRRSLCYDYPAWDARKANKPESNAIDTVTEMGIELLTEEQYRQLQGLGKFDQKTSSWIQTPHQIRELGGAIFCDRRYNTVFMYHNGADSYYAARGFRGSLRV
ncbi:DUF4256 domain-containing protein [Chryseobacterium lactis]|uniref:DUF4256 domain-containing protein n=1 Tax=Chryseobacterium lactis TaxID=1241981 RepID=A0A3G6RQ43_CHRLC|nr:DUF4256 domain-containing protein [Chryseobacterium lactis]AZA83759.1 DUF4256 domain-containing protein [Chryseobacterium lactis]AZB04144.1 DUF4256 domain-containing protein [Chryseobacterium lactis]PNW12947.1 DUF4256 domain-containing protein [Chryseobacterium lactis]